MTDIAVKGLAELNAALQALPARIEKNVLKQALYQGAKVIRDEAKAIAPEAPPNNRNAKHYGGKAGALKKSIRAGVDFDRKQGKAVAYVRAGRHGKKRKGKGSDAYYAVWVEYGTAAHWIGVNGSGKLARIANRKGLQRALKIGGNLVPSVMHLGAKPHPYLRPALDRAARAATVAVGEYIKGKLSQKLTDLDLSGVNLEVEE